MTETISPFSRDLISPVTATRLSTLISSDAILTAALQIHSVEARHAAQVRRIGGKKPWDGAFDEPMPKEDVLAAATPFLA